MTPVREAVLELTSALHNWRRDPSPANMRAVIVAGDVVSGFALELERRSELTSGALPTHTICVCGHIRVAHKPEGGPCIGRETIKHRGSYEASTGACPCQGFSEAPHA